MALPTTKEKLAAANHENTQSLQMEQWAQSGEILQKLFPAGITKYDVPLPVTEEDFQQDTTTVFWVKRPHLPELDTATHEAIAQNVHYLLTDWGPVLLGFGSAEESEAGVYDMIRDLGNENQELIDPASLKKLVSILHAHSNNNLPQTEGTNSPWLQEKVSVGSKPTHDGMGRKDLPFLYHDAHILLAAKGNDEFLEGVMRQIGFLAGASEQEIGKVEFTPGVISATEIVRTVLENAPAIPSDELRTQPA